MVIPLPPNARGYKKSAEYFAKMENCDLKILSTQADFSEIPDAGGIFCGETSFERLRTQGLRSIHRMRRKEKKNN